MPAAAETGDSVEVTGPVHEPSPFAAHPPPAPLRLRAATLGDALDAYEEAYGAEIFAADGHGGRYFVCQDLDSGDEYLVDVHVLREGEELCPRQDRGFALRPGDRVLLMGLLAC